MWLRRSWSATAGLVLAAVLCGLCWPPLPAFAEEPSPSPSSSVSGGDGSSSVPSSSPPSSPDPVPVESSPAPASPSPTGEVVFVDVAPDSELMWWLRGMALAAVLCVLFLVGHVVGSWGR